MADVQRPSSSQAELNSIAERDFVLLLISLYRDLPELWKVNTKGYLNKDKRSIAIQKMLNVLKTYKPDYDEDKLKKKINVLRTNFNKEYHKIEQKKWMYASSDDIPEPSLWYYNELLFIKEEQEEKADSHCESQPSINKSPSTSNAVKRQKKKRSSPIVSTEEKIFLPEPNFKTLRHDNDTEILEVLAKSWALKLSRLAPDQKCFAEKIINDTLFEAEMGTLTRNGVYFLKASETVTSRLPVKNRSPSSSP